MQTELPGLSYGSTLGYLIKRYITLQHFKPIKLEKKKSLFKINACLINLMKKQVLHFPAKILSKRIGIPLSKILSCLPALVAKGSNFDGEQLLSDHFGIVDPAV